GSAGSAVKRTSVSSRKGRPASRQRRRVPRSGRPASKSARVWPASIQRQLPPLPLASTQIRTERMYQERLLACKSTHSHFSCYSPRHGTDQEEHQEPEQGEAGGAEATAGPPQQGLEARQARPITLQHLE